MVSLSPIENIKIGDTASMQRTIAESDVYLYAGITGDMHPNHTNQDYASARFGGRVMHGALLTGFISRCAVDVLGDRLDPVGYAAQSFAVKCVAPILIGDTISVSVTVESIDPERRKIVFRAEVTKQGGTLCAFGEKVVKVLKASVAPQTAEAVS